MSITPGETSVSEMSTESTSYMKSAMSIMTISPEDKLSLSPPCPPYESDSDNDMSDLSNFQKKWSEFDPLSPMSVTEAETEVDKVYKKTRSPVKSRKRSIFQTLSYLFKEKELKFYFHQKH